MDAEALRQTYQGSLQRELRNMIVCRICILTPTLPRLLEVLFLVVLQEQS